MFLFHNTHLFHYFHVIYLIFIVFVIIFLKQIFPSICFSFFVGLTKDDSIWQLSVVWNRINDAAGFDRCALFHYNRTKHRLIKEIVFMKMSKRIAVFFLLILLTFTLSACKNKDEKAIIGQWSVNADGILQMTGLTQEEYDGALSWLELCGVTNGYTQEFSSATTEFLPEFNFKGIF